MMNMNKPSDTPSARAWYSLGVMVALFFAANVDRTIISILIGPIKSDLGLDDFSVSLLMGAAFGVSYVACALPFGWAGDRFPRPVLLAIGICIWSIGCASGGFVMTFTGLFLARTMVGAGEACLTPIAHPLISDLFPRRKIPTAIAIYNFSGSVGGALAFVIGGFIADVALRMGGASLPFVGELRPWQLALILVGLPGLPLAIACLVTLPEPRNLASRAAGVLNVARMDPLPRQPLGEFVSRHRLLIVCHFLGFGIAMLVTLGIAAWLPQFMERSFKWSLTQIGTAMAVLVLGGGFIGQFMSVKAIERLTSAGYKDAALRAFIFALIGGVAASCVAFMANTPTISVVGILFSIIFLHPVTTYGSSALQLFVPSNLRGRLSGVFVTVIYLMGMGLGPSAIAFVTRFLLKDESQLDNSLLIVSVMGQILAIALLAIALAPMSRAIREIEGDGIVSDDVRQAAMETVGA